MVDETKMETAPLSADDVIKVENARAKNKLKTVALGIGGAMSMTLLAGTVYNQVTGNTQADGGAIGATFTQLLDVIKFVFAF